MKQRLTLIQASDINRSYIFKIMNKNNDITNRINTFIQKGVIATPDKIDLELSTIRRNFKNPAKDAVLEAYQNGDLIPVVTPKGLETRMPTGIPFVLLKHGSNDKANKALVFIDNYAKLSDDGTTIQIDTKKLYCLLESAYMALNLKPQARIQVISKGSNIFAHLFTRILNKEFSLNTNKQALNKVMFVASKYFMIKHLGLTDDDTVFNYAIKNCNSATAILMKEVNDTFTEDTMEDISTFISALATNYYHFVPGFNKLTTREYIESFSKLYGRSALFALENINYFFFTLSSIVTGAYLNNQSVLEDIIDKDAVKLYLECSVG